MPTEQENQFIAGWRFAGPELERIRNEELRNLDEAAGTRQATFLGIALPAPVRSGAGLFQFQVFMKKWRAQESERAARNSNK